MKVAEARRSMMSASSQRREVVEVDGLEHKTPIPAGVRIGGLVFSSAITGRDPATGAYPPDVAEQATIAFNKLRSFAREAGASIDDIAHIRVYLRSLDDRPALNDAWLAMFPDPKDRPCRHVVISDIAQFNVLLRMQLEVTIVLPQT